ncbi:MAG: hypothetical protein KH703_09590 [Campylobacter gracilis]|uniref:hypothetical protein n=1 Tax=Campylobacter gracilis TaxID=824 RepID=UPI0026041FE6|nr:hypothetical protein [Campylobacter gracilis]MBS6153621.1 hypothetical protein [Campylobacter gracilis]
MEYRNFKVTDIFIVETGANIPQNELKSGKTPRISVTNLDNGISGYYNDLSSNNYRVKKILYLFLFWELVFIIRIRRV